MLLILKITNQTNSLTIEKKRLLTTVSFQSISNTLVQDTILDIIF